MEKAIAVLYARQDSIYKKFPDLDVFDIERDARTYQGGLPVIAHPPCRGWGKLRGVAKTLPGEKELGFHAVEMVRKWGGVLEHPCKSRLWMDHSVMQDSEFPDWKGIIRPGKGVDEWGGFSIDINQSWFGHKARKRTWLYVCGLQPMEMPQISLSFDAITHTVCTDPKKIKKELSKKAREATPLKLAQWMISVCNIINQKKANGKADSKNNYSRQITGAQ